MCLRYVSPFGPCMPTPAGAGPLWEPTGLVPRGAGAEDSLLRPLESHERISYLDRR